MFHVKIQQNVSRETYEKGYNNMNKLPTITKLDTATKTITKIENETRRNLYMVATVLNTVNTLNLYEEGEYKGVGDYAEKTFGYKKSTTSTLCTVASRFLTDKAESIFKQDDTKDFTIYQLAELLPLNNDQIEDLVETGELNSYMTTKKIRDLVKTCIAIPENVSCETPDKAGLEQACKITAKNGLYGVTTNGYTDSDNVSRETVNKYEPSFVDDSSDKIGMNPIQTNADNTSYAYAFAKAVTLNLDGKFGTCFYFRRGNTVTVTNSRFFEDTDVEYIVRNNVEADEFDKWEALLFDEEEFDGVKSLPVEDVQRILGYYVSAVEENERLTEAKLDLNTIQRACAYLGALAKKVDENHDYRGETILKHMDVVVDLLMGIDLKEAYSKFPNIFTELSDMNKN